MFGGDMTYPRPILAKFGARMISAALHRPDQGHREAVYVERWILNMTELIFFFHRSEEK